MSDEILLQPYFDKLTEKLDNSSEYEDWLIIQEYIDGIRRENKNLKQELKATGKGLNKVLSKRQKWKYRYYKELRVRHKLENWLEEEKQLNGDVTMKISEVSIDILRKIKELKGSDE